MKVLRLALAALASLSLVACSQADPLDDLWTKNIYPGTNSTYKIGDNATAYSQGWFDRLYITDNTSVFNFNGLPLTFGGGSSGNVSTLNDLTDVTITAPSANQTLKYNGAQWVNDNATAGAETDPIFGASAAGGITGANITNWDAAYAGIYTDEQAQDAIGTILTDSTSIDFTYNDGAPSITASANITTGTSTNMTGIITGNGSTLSAVSNTLHTQGTDTTLGTTTGNIAIGSGYNVDFVSALSSDHTWSGFTATFTAGENVTMTDACYINSTAGKLKKALSTATSTMPAVALSTGTIAQDATGTFLTYGFFRDDSWAWTIGGYIYVSKDTAGLLTQTQPTGSGKQVQIVAIALTGDIIFWNPQWVIVGLK